jgi:hypothetical protein
MISLAKEIEDAELLEEFEWFDFHDDRIEQEFKKAVHLNSKWSRRTHNGRTVIIYKPNEEALRKSLGDLTENTAVMAALDWMKTKGKITWVH